MAKSIFQSDTPFGGRINGVSYSRQGPRWVLSQRGKGFNPRSQRQWINRQNFAHVARYYESILDPGAKENWRLWAENVNYTSYRGGLGKPMRGIDWFMMAAMPVYLYSLDGTIELNPNTDSYDTPYFLENITYFGGAFYLGRYFLGFDWHPTDKIFIWATNKIYGDPPWVRRKKHFSGWAYVPEPDDDNITTVIVPDQYAGQRNSGEIIVGYELYWNSPNIGNADPMACIVP